MATMHSQRAAVAAAAGTQPDERQATMRAYPRKDRFTLLHFITSFHLLRFIYFTSLYLGLILGQDWASIGNYTAAFPLDTHTPFGYMAYTAITFAGLENGTNLLGLRSPVDYGSGIEWTKGLLDTYANSSLNLGLYMVDSSAHIMDGALDEDIDRLAHFLKRYPSRSIYLRCASSISPPSPSVALCLCTCSNCCVLAGSGMSSTARRTTTPPRSTSEPSAAYPTA